MKKTALLFTLLLMTPTAPAIQSQKEIAIQNFVDDPNPKSGTLLVLRLSYIGGGCCILHDILEELPGPEGIGPLPRQTGVYYVVEVKQAYQVDQLPLNYETKRIDEGP